MLPVALSRRSSSRVKAVSQLGCQDRSLSGCKAPVVLQLLLLPGGTAGARGLQPASACVVGGVGFPGCPLYLLSLSEL